MADESGFVIDGSEYEIPGLDTFDMDEAQLLYDYSGLTLEDFVVDEADEEAAAEVARKLKNPGFIRVLLQVAYQRGNPGVSATRAKAIIGKSNLLEAFKNFVEADAGPPEIPETPSLLESSSSSPESSGDASRNGSDAQDEIPKRTGITESDTFPTLVETP